MKIRSTPLATGTAETVPAKWTRGVPQWEAMFGIIVLGVGVVGALFIKARIATYIHNL